MSNSTMGLNWWEMNKEPAKQAASVFSVLTRIRQRDRSRFERNDDCMTLYGNYGAFPRQVYTGNAQIRERPRQLREKYNVVSSCTDSLTAKIAQMRPVITFLTEGGDWSGRRLGENLGQFMRGLFYSNNIYRTCQQMFQDACIFDIGAIKHYREGNKIYSERVMAFDLSVEDVDAMYGDPCRLYQSKIMSKAAAKKLWPKFKSQIETSESKVDYGSFVVTEDQVLVVEAWKLASEEGKDDGEHIIAVSNTVVFSEKYDRTVFPFTFYRWSWSGMGFWGESLANRLLPNQISINRMLQVMQKSFHLGSTYKVFLEYGSKVMKNHINNEIGALVEYHGKPPIFNAPSVISPEYGKHVDWLIERSYQEAGVSELMAQAKKPAGLDSRVAMREYNDLQSERFVIAAQRYEECFLDIASHYMYLCQQIDKEGGTLKVSAESKNFLKQINWKDVAVYKDGFLAKMFPTSMLPHTPAGQLAMVQDLLESGILPQQYALDLLNWPDLKRYTTLETAAIEDILCAIENILDGEYEGPEPFQDLKLGIRLFQSAYLYHKRLKAPVDRLDDLINWMRQAEAMLAKSQQAVLNTQDQLASEAQGAQAQQPQPAQLQPAV